MRVPFNDLSRDQNSSEAELRAALDRVLLSGNYVLGQEVEAFEREFAEYCGTKFCVGVANGTDALELGLRAVEVEPGQEVITVANAGMYATTAILAIGARPRFVDVEEDSMNVAVDQLEGLIQEKTAAVVATHLYGRLSNVRQVVAVAEKHGLPVIEDCAQAHGAVTDGRKAGSWGTVGCFSFYPTKNLGALGDGGAVTTSDRGIATRLTRLRQYGWEAKYRSVIRGGRNSRLDEIQAAVLRLRLRGLDGLNEVRRELALTYDRKLNGLPLVLPEVSGPEYVAHLYVVRHPRRDALIEHLKRRRVGVAIHFPIPDHQQPALSELREAECSLPNTENLASEVGSLPLFPGLQPEEIDYVVGCIEDFFEKVPRSELPAST